MFEIINNICLIVLEIICNRIYFSAFFHNRNDLEKGKLYLYSALHALSFLLIGTFIENFVLREIIAVVSMTLIMYLMKDGKILNIFFAAMIFAALLILLDYATLKLIYYLFNQFDSNSIGSTLSGRLCVVIDKTVLMIVVLFMKMRSDTSKGKGLVETEWIRFIFFPVFTIISALSMALYFSNIENMQQANVLYAIALCMVLMNLFMYYLINDVIERENSLINREAEYSQFKNKIDIYNTLYDSLERQKKKTHDFKNHIICVDALAREKKYEELESYITDIRKSSFLDRNVIDTNNVIVNTILNEKYDEMMRKGIVFVFRINDLSQIPMENEDLVVLLSNILDNAIEACEKCDGDRIIRMKFMMEGDLVVLSVKNTSNGSWNGVIGQSTKESYTSEHGIGIRNIENTVEKYNGTYSIKSKEDEFYFAILIPIRAEMSYGYGG